MDLYQYELIAYDQGFSAVCGIDEAGRGPLAGDVYAAAVILPRGVEIAGVNDSKKLTEKKREALFDEITARAAAYSIAAASVAEIDEMNILRAAMLAMRRAAEGLSVKPTSRLSTATATRGSASPPRRSSAGTAGARRSRRRRFLAKVARTAI